MPKPRTLNDLRNDPRVAEVDYDSCIGERGGYDLLLKDGYKFDGERSLSVGTIKSLCADMDTVVKVD